MDVICGTCGHYVEQHWHGPCEVWLLAGGLVVVCTCSRFVSIREALAA